LYPSVEGAFVVTELPFLKDNKIVNFLKIRGNVSQIGKDANPLSIVPQLIPTTWTGGGYKYDWTGPNKELKPEMTTSWEVGFEGRFLNDRIVADFTYYQTHCEDQIVSSVRMSYANGFVLNTRNMGAFKTWGWDFHIDGDIINNAQGLRWNLGVNLSHVGSKMTEFPVAGYYDAYTWNSGNVRNGVEVGKPITALMGIDYERNKDGVVLISPTAGTPLLNTGISYLGDREPDIRLGLSTTVSYKGVRLSALFAGKLGATVVNGTQRDMINRGSSNLSVKWREREGAVIFNGVLKDGLENTDHPTQNNIALNWNKYSNTIYNGNDPDWIQTGINYLRLQELRLAYTVPTKFLKKAFGGLVSYLNVFVTGNDLFTLTNYDGTDAVGNTISASAGGVGGEGYDIYSLPSPRGISCGLNITF
jgi:hypothetical protein